MASFTTPPRVFDPTFRDRVRDANPLEDLVNADLLAAGHPPLSGHGDELDGWHPVHGSQSGASLKVNVGKQLYTCFNCGEGGDVFTWVMQAQRCSFLEALHTLAQRAGIALPHLDPAQQQQWQQAQQDRHDLEDLFRAAAAFFHSQLTQEHRDFCVQQWGLTAETIERYQLGFAPAAPGALQWALASHHFAVDAIRKSGLVIQVGNHWHDFFQGRLIFPYWRDLPDPQAQQPGTPLYFIGRRMDGVTPDQDWEHAKYRKQLVHSAKHAYVSPAVTNAYFYGEHALRGIKDTPLLVTEGVADCLAALQVDLPTISPVTVRFSKTSYPRLLQLAKQAKHILICNDSEDNAAGSKGALATAAFLDAEGIDVRLVTLPRAPDVPKIDLADYLRAQTVGEFQALCALAPTYLEAQLQTCAVSPDAFTNCLTARKFVTDVLSQCTDTQRARAFLRHRVKAYFKLHDRDLKDLEACCTPGQAQSSGAAATPSTAPPPPPEPWRKALLCTQGGDPKECASNYALFLAHHPRLAGRLWWDAVRHRPMRDDLPLRDELITELGAWLGQEERVSVHALRLLERCAHAVAYRDQRDPLKEWLATLDPWDQIPNLSTWFPLVTGAPPTPYHQWLGQMLIVSMVARALDPGCIQRYVLILEGAEDTGKSALAQALAPDYYTTLSMALESKEAHIHIMGSWIVELTELDALSRTDESRIKAFITMRSDDYVPKFANSPVSYLRRSIFVGTTNEPQYLRGQTGNTRFFPVRTQVINLALFETLRLSLFAEALEFYHKHPQDWWVVPDAVKPELEIAREQRRIDTPFEELIGAWLPGQTAAEFTWKEIATGALGITEMERLKDKRLQMDVAAAMRRFGYERKTSKHGGPKAVKVWRT